jgi:hypothetical protein
MKRSVAALTPLSWGLGLLALASCSDPSKPDTTAHPPAPTINEGIEDCAASADWLPTTPELTATSSATNSFERPAPHPATECPFYRGAWQTFLVAGQPDSTGEPAIKSLPVLDDVFDRYTPIKANLAAPGAPRGNSKRAWLGDIKQAGGREILLDQNGHTLYYGIHVNQAFADFVQANNLTTAYAVQNADPNIFFSAGIAEFKTAWQEVDTQDPNNPDENSPELKDYIWTTAWVPTLSQDAATGTVEEDRDKPRLITARLLAIHAVFTIPGHPEFVWGSFEHTDADIFNGDTDTKAADGHRNVAPLVAEDPVTHEVFNPSFDDLSNKNNGIIAAAEGLHNSPDGYLLYKLGTPANKADLSVSEADLQLDAMSQKFFLKSDPTTPAATSIYRMYPASKSNTVDPDDAISSLNHNVEAIYKMAQQNNTLDPKDRRWHYRLLGAQWMDKPTLFTLNSRLQNDSTSPLVTNPSNFASINQADERDKLLANPATPPVGFNEAIVCRGVSQDGCNALKAIAVDGSDSGFSMLAGEDRMSSTAMESFTQAGDTFFNCFQCHNTQSISTKGVPIQGSGQVKLLDPKLINVSHVFSQIVLEECANNVVDNAFVCPKP